MTAAPRRPARPPAGADPGPDESVDQLFGPWWIYQLRRGHRFSTDDLVCAWEAARARPDARRCLDLGCGTGSVGLYTLGLLGHADATLVGLEAQEVSVGLYRRTLRLNGLEHRVTVHQGDLRDPQALPEGARFPLITGSPPYIPVGKGAISPHPQRAHCRIELRGSIYDYCSTAARHLAPGGAFVFVMAAADPRTEDAPLQAGLVVTRRLDVVFREGSDPLIAVLTCEKAGPSTSAARATDTLVVRDHSGHHTEAYAALRRTAQLGGPP